MLVLSLVTLLQECVANYKLATRETFDSLGHAWLGTESPTMGEIPRHFFSWAIVVMFGMLSACLEHALNMSAASGPLLTRSLNYTIA